MKMKKSLLCFLTMLGFCATSMAQSSESPEVMWGQKYSDIKDYTNALQWFQKGATNGDAQAQYHLGFMYANGLGVDQDNGKALQLYQEAATGGNVQGQLCMGYIYANGLIGIHQDNNEALQWFQKAAQQGNMRAQYNLETLRGEGKGVLQHTSAALFMGIGSCLPQERPTPQQIDAVVQNVLSHLVFVEGGTFMMGDFGPEHQEDRLSYTGSRDARPLHEVTLDSFSIMPYLVTYEEFDFYAASQGKAIPNDYATKYYRIIPEMAAGVNWFDAKAYCQWLGQQTGLPFDLATEAQWEYAARSRGQYMVYATDNGKREEGRNISSYQQRGEMINQSSEVSTHPIGRFPSSPLGLYDMGLLGSEWVNDWYAADYYAHSPSHNPQGPETGENRVMRGAYSTHDYQFSTTMTRIQRGPSTYRTPINHVIRCVVNSPNPVKP
jgi:formylglycine-generating enzyme required for sulfatase activity